MKTFKKTDTSLRYDLTNIDKMDWFDTNNVLWLEKNGVRVILANKRAADYSLHINKLIAENIHSCHDLFPDWIKWDYIKRLFIIPKFTDTEILKREFSKFMDKLECYPYHQYIFWEPEEYGNILYTDGKFIKILYQMNDDYFDDKSKYKTATDDIKDNIYDFIGNSEKIVLVVDCERLS